MLIISVIWELKTCKFTLYLRFFFMLNIYCKRHLVNSFLRSTDETNFNWQTNAIVAKIVLAFIHEINCIKGERARPLLLQGYISLRSHTFSRYGARKYRGLSIGAFG